MSYLASIADKDIVTKNPGESVDFSPDRYLIRGIRVDNFSNQWYYVGYQVQRYIPPLTIGWTANVQPAQSRLVIQAVGAPAGAVASSPSGDKIQVTIYENMIGDYDGNTYGSVTLNTNPQIHIFGSFTSATAGVDITAATPIGQFERAVLLYWAIGPVPFDVTSTRPNSQWLSSDTGFELFTNNAFVDFMTINPAAPYREHNFYPYGIPCEVGSDVFILGYTPDKSDPSIKYCAHYYVVSA